MWFLPITHIIFPVITIINSGASQHDDPYGIATAVTINSSIMAIFLMIFQYSTYWIISKLNKTSHLKISITFIGKLIYPWMLVRLSTSALGIGEELFFISSNVFCLIPWTIYLFKKNTKKGSKTSKK